MIKDYGFTLIELMVVIFIFLIISAAVYGILTIGRQSWYIGSTQVELQQEVRRGMDRMIRELRQSGQNTIVDVPADDSSYSTITFQIPEDTDGDGDVIDDGGNIEWGSQITYSLGGLNNQQLLRSSGGTSTVLANNVINLQFKRSSTTPNILEISLQAEKDTVRGRTIQLTLSSQVSLRN